MKLRSLVGKLRETAGTWYFLREHDWFTGGLVDWNGLDTGDWFTGLLGDWRNSWGIVQSLAREERRGGELVRLLGFWLLHARLKYNLLRNYGPTKDMVHERRKEYKLSNTIAKVEQDKGVHYGPLEPCS